MTNLHLGFRVGGRRGPPPGSKRPRAEASSNTGYSCPKCEAHKTHVKDSRQTEDGNVRRKRVCSACEFGFFTVEVMEGAVITNSRQEQLKLFERILPDLYRIADTIDLLRAEHE